MDIYKSISITSRVELFTRKSFSILEETWLDFAIAQQQPAVQTAAGNISFGGNPHMNGDHSNSIDKSTFGEKEYENTQSRFKVLHIEDDEEIRFLLKTFLKNYVDVDTASDGTEAMERTSKHEYDLIITDINLGEGINGIEAIRRIRNKQNHMNVPVIAATAYASSKIRNQCIEAGMDAFLLKPFMKMDLINTIEQVMGKLNRNN